VVQLLTEEIMPKLEALRNEKRSFLAFQKATSELERLLRLVKAYEWLEASKREAKSGETLEAKKASLEEKKQLLVWLGNKQTKMEKEMGEILKKREKVSLVTQATCINRFRRWKRKGRLADRGGMGFSGDGERREARWPDGRRQDARTRHREAEDPARDQDQGHFGRGGSAQSDRADHERGEPIFTSYPSFSLSRAPD
jgi:hypothetical protein